MTTDETLMQQALDALEQYAPWTRHGSFTKQLTDAAIAALRDRLARPVVPPDLPSGAAEYFYEWDAEFGTVHRAFSPSAWNGRPPDRSIKVYTHPAAPAPVPLTDEQIIALNANEVHFSESPSKYPEAGHGTQYHAGAPGVISFARAIEAAHGIGGER